uniref:hypothetical protein n=1 Tax=Marinobacterium profundum TaxID=1714300 RepID=UPI00082E54EA|nr:hypothetical protein [Marinobacterium profundum]
MDNQEGTERWVMDFMPDGRVNFSRFVDGALEEKYRPATRAEATVWAAAIIQGYQPPASLRSQDRGWKEAARLKLAQGAT